MDKLPKSCSYIEMYEKINEIVAYINAKNQAEIDRLQAKIKQLGEQAHLDDMWVEFVKRYDI